MCYLTYIGTTSDMDLSEYNTEHMHLVRISDAGKEGAFLKYPYIWLATDAHEECSCGFRSLELPNVELGFCEPEDWLPEAQEDIEASHAIYQVILQLLKAEAKVESITFWIDSKASFIDMSVDLSSITASQFRFFDGYRFDYQVNT